MASAKVSRHVEKVVGYPPLRSTLVSRMSRTTTSREPIAHAMTTDDKARAGRRARRLNERRRSESFRWEVPELPDGRFEVVALAKG